MVAAALCLWKSSVILLVGVMNKVVSRGSSRDVPSEVDVNVPGSVMNAVFRAEGEVSYSEQAKYFSWGKFLPGSTVPISCARAVLGC